MTAGELLTLVVLGSSLLVACPLLARYLDAVFGGGTAPGDRVLLPVERFIYRCLRTGPDRGQGWAAYTLSALSFGLASVVGLYFILRIQGSLPFNPTGVDGMSPALAFNTAASFVTGTNWQAYSGESAMTHLGQMAGLVVAQFTAGAVGLAVGVAFLRGITRRSPFLGNFWVDLTRAITRMLLPIASLSALALVSQGAVQNFRGATAATTIEGAAQMIPGGPVATMAAIKTLGTNGGAFLRRDGEPFRQPQWADERVPALAVLGHPVRFRPPVWAVGR